MADLIDLVTLYPTSTGGGGGVSSHPALSDLPWSSAGHTGTANGLAAFNGNGIAEVITHANVISPITTLFTDTKEPTGWVDPTAITVSYDYSTRKITLTGTLVYYFKGVKYTLVSPWTSDEHTTTQTGWFLYSTDGVNFTWSTNVWTFDQLMVAKVTYGASAGASYAIVETHSTMPWQVHRELHAQIGTYRSSGGALTVGTYIENTANDAANTPGFDSATVIDEDIPTVIPVWTQGTYTTMYVGAAGASVFNTASSLPFIADGSFMQVNNATAGTMSDGIGNRYYNIYQLLVPAASDANSQLYRMIMIQPQATYTSLTAAQAEDPRNLNLGSLSSAATEYILYARITYVTAAGDSNTGKCRIATGGVSYITGNKFSQTASGGATSHANLSDLSWTSSGHTGTANKVAGFDANGVATEYDQSDTGTIKKLAMIFGG